MICKFRIESQKSRSVVTIGNFDGFHLGHQFLLQQARKIARQNNLKLIVLTFTPHPRIFLGHRLELISTDQQRRENLINSGYEGEIFFLSFGDYRKLTVDEFMQKILLRELNCARLVVGEDFRLGAGRSCHTECLISLAEKYGLEVVVVGEVKIGNFAVSSSAVRKLLQRGEIALANRMLNHPYYIDGIVVEGRRRGRRIGFPTANLKVKNRILPEGVFFSSVKIDGQEYYSLTNIGFNPTFGMLEKHVETHILNFSSDIYGRRLRLYLLEKVRSEKKFKNEEQLKEQIIRDIQNVKLRFLSFGCCS